VDNDSINALKFYRNNPHWKRTIYIIGLPRSGKTTLLNIIGTCENVETIEEPFEISLVAQKASMYPENSQEFAAQMDTYMSLVENLFCEITIGRRLNFRSSDSSFIKNQKTSQNLKQRFGITSKRNLINYLETKNIVFALTLNESESCLNFITQKVPKPLVLLLERDLKQVISEVYKKEWLSNKSLSAQIDMTPAYFIKKIVSNKVIHVPYLIKEKDVDTFLKSGDLDRVKIYINNQNKILVKNIKNLKIPVIKINYDELISYPNNVIRDLLGEINLQPTYLTKLAIKKLKKRKTNNEKISINEK